MSVSVVDTTAGPVSVERHGEGPDLVMLHSLLTDRHVYDRVLRDLDTDHRVTLVDLPGHGATPLTPPTIDAAADVIGALLGSGDYQPQSTALLGNGLGAFIALGTAIRHGELFAKLILAGCGATFPDAARPAFRTMADNVAAGGMEAVVEQALGRIFSPAYAASHPEMLEERRTVLLAMNPEAFIAACHALERFDYEDEVPTVANPALVVVGSEDGPTPPEMGKSLAAAIPQCGYVELPGVAHAPQLEAPEAFVGAIRPFLAA